MTRFFIVALASLHIVICGWDFFVWITWANYLSKPAVVGAFRSLMPHAKNAVTRFLRLSLTFYHCTGAQCRYTTIISNYYGVSFWVPSLQYRLLRFIITFFPAKSIPLISAAIRLMSTIYARLVICVAWRLWTE